MRKSLKYLIVISALFLSIPAQSQLLMGLIFGDDLNSENLEFGLSAGINFANLTNLDGVKTKSGLQLGSYFYYKPKEIHSLHIELLAFNDHGTDNIPTYQLNDTNLDAVLTDATVARTNKYISLNVMYRYRFIDHFYLEAGWSGGILTKAFDQITQIIEDREISIRNDLTDDFNRIETGPIAGVSYKFLKSEGVAVNLFYYHGLTNTLKGSGIKNRSLRVGASIPIGKKKKQRKMEEEKRQQELLEKEGDS
ncbi:outer membrane beta-barrel protein [Robertkochia sediminum]|uniref:outer membrane beta-barrel protein n=1 Tax=Robertkochia sediminum TaxID=2785326 RepID=UPI00193355EA|nr:outer membrane beta-barrel protein [Robertkochia sediminum]MBL7473791.1 PorT family protein [Robertkochia sediminum]